MNSVKKLFALLMSIVLVLTFAGCGGETQGTSIESQVSSNTKETIEVKPLTYKRLQSVTIEDKDDGETKNFSVVWDGEGCYFDADSRKDYDIHAILDSETNIFYLEIPDEIDVPFQKVPIHQYDEYGRIVKFWDEDDISNECIVSYDGNGLPVFKYPESVREFGLEEFEYDANTRQVKVPYSSGVSNNDDGTVTRKQTYHIRTINQNGDILTVDSLTVITLDDEKISEESEKDVYKYTYDENGNIIKFETKYKTMTFTYTDETIHHVWERNIPIYYTGWYYMYDMPFFWNVK